MEQQNVHNEARDVLHFVARVSPDAADINSAEEYVDPQPVSGK